MNTIKRKSEWKNLPEPKPDWETFKRMLNFSKGNTAEALQRWKIFVNQKHIQKQTFASW